MTCVFSRSGTFRPCPTCRSYKVRLSSVVVLKRNEYIFTFRYRSLGWPGILGQEPWRKPPAVHGVSDDRIVRGRPIIVAQVRFFVFAPSQLLEFRPGSSGVKARSIQVEFVRIETMPGGGMYPSLVSLRYDEVDRDPWDRSDPVTGQNAICVVGAPVTVWQAPAGKEWDSIQAASRSTPRNGPRC